MKTSKPTRSMRFLVSCLALAALLAGCSFPQFGPPPPGQVQPAQPAALPGSGPTGQNGGAAAGTPAPGAGSQPGGSGSTAGSLPPNQPESAAVSTVFPGLYLNDQAALKEYPNAAEVVSDLPCSALVDMLASGQWQETLSRQTASVGSTEVVELRQGDQTIILSASGEACHARLELLTSQDVTLQGAVSGAGKALEYPYMCASSGDQAEVSLFFEGPGDARSMAGFSFAPQVGEQVITDTENTAFSAGTGQMSMFDMVAGPVVTATGSISSTGSAAATATAGADSSGSDGSSPSDTNPFTPAGFYEFHAGPDFKGTVTVKSTGPLAGVVNMTGLVDDAGAEQSVQASFACGDVLKLSNKPAKEASTPVPMPADLPLPPNATLTSNLANSTFVVKSTDPVDTVAGWYKANLPAQGWALTHEDHSIPNIVFLDFTKESKKLNISVTKHQDDGTTGVLIEVR